MPEREEAKRFRFGNTGSYLWDRGRPARLKQRFAQVAIESGDFNDVAFHVSGRDARGPKQSLASFGIFALIARGF